MTPQQFTAQFREAFGEAAELPIAIWYDTTAAASYCRVPRCMIGAIRKVCNGESLTLTAESVQCGGGALYTAFRPMPERVPLFVSETEHYKCTPEMVCDYIAGLGIELTDKPFLNFVRVDKLKSWEGVESVLFFATPDILSGLCTWAFYDSNAADTVVTPLCFGLRKCRNLCRNGEPKRRKTLLLGHVRPLGTTSCAKK